MNDNGELWGLALWVGSVILSIYAAVKDFAIDKYFWALLDIVFFIPIGFFRGIMYLLG